MTKTQNYWKRLTATLWFIPAMLAVCGALLGLLIVAVDYNANKFGLSPDFLDIQPSRPPLYFDGDELRLVVNQQRFEDYFDLAFNQIRQNAGGNVGVILRLLNAMEVLGKANQSFNIQNECEERHELLETQARLLFHLAENTFKADADLQSVIRRYNHVNETLTGLR